MTKICWLTVSLIVQGLQVSLSDSHGIRASKGSRDLIIGGTDADPKKYPFFTWLNIEADPFSSSTSSCGGTLINPDVVLTAAQCVSGRRNIDVWVNSTSRKYSEYEYIRKAKQIVTHPKYSPSKSGNDIGLIFLDSPVNNVPLARLNRNVSIPGNARSIVTAVGFGRVSKNSFGDDIFSSNDDDDKAYPENLKVASFYTVTPRSCLKTLGSWVVHESHICASEGISGACVGDVGGPLIHPRASSLGYGQIGIVSTILSSSCVSEGVPQLFTDVAKFGDWIDQTICKFSKSKPKSCSKT